MKRGVQDENESFHRFFAIVTSSQKLIKEIAHSCYFHSSSSSFTLQT